MLLEKRMKAVQRCGKQQKVYLDTKSKNYVIVPWRCGELLCPSCGAKMEAHFREQMIASVYKYDMRFFSTLTITDDFGLGELRKVFRRYYEQVNMLNEKYYIDKSEKKKPGVDHAEAYARRMEKVLEFEIDSYFLYEYKVEAVDMDGKVILDENGEPKKISLRYKWSDELSRMINRGVIAYPYFDKRGSQRAIYFNNVGKWKAKKYIDILEHGRGDEFYKDNEKYFKKRLNEFIEGLDYQFYEKRIEFLKERIYRNLDEDFTYVCVLEFQENGAPHYHILSNRYAPYYVFNKIKSKTSKINECVDLSAKKKFKNGESAKDIEVAIAQYLTKYLTKDIAEATIAKVERIEDLYSKSRNLGNLTLTPQIVEDEIDTDDEESDGNVVDSSVDKRKGTYEFYKSFASMDLGYNRVIGKTKEEADAFIAKHLDHDFEGFVPNSALNKAFEKDSANRKEKSIIKRELRSIKKGVFSLDACLKVVESVNTEIHSLIKRNIKNVKTVDDFETIMDIEYRDNYFDLQNRMAAISIRERIEALRPLRKPINKKDYTPPFNFSQKQQEFFDAFANPNITILLMTGSAGTGKTTVMSTLLSMFDLDNFSIDYCSLAGKAVQRIKEQASKVDTTINANTIHTLCQSRYSHISGNFARHKLNLLDTDILIIDEISMCDAFTLAALLDAVKDECKIIMVGDTKQLNPVQSFNMIDAFQKCKMKDFRHVELDRNYRSTNEINQIAMSVINRDFSNFKYESMDVQSICKLAAQKHLDGYRVLCNGRMIRKKINLHISEFKKEVDFLAIYKYDIGDEILIGRNDKKRDLYNGDLLTIVDIEVSKSGEKLIVCEHNITKVPHRFSYADSTILFTPAWSMTIHKSQGSEYEKVLAVFENKSFLLNNNILYTAITRAQSVVEVILHKDVNVESFKEKQRSQYVYDIFDDYILQTPEYRSLEFSRVIKEYSDVHGTEHVDLPSDFFEIMSKDVRVSDEIVESLKRILDSSSSNNSDVETVIQENLFKIIDINICNSQINLL